MTEHTTPAAPARYPAPLPDILAAQDAGYRSFTTEEPCPHTTNTPTSRFLREQWAKGRGAARADALEAAGMLD